MGDETTEYDLAELVKGSVDSIEAKLSDLPGADLAMLHDLEKDGKKRSTLLDAIHREQKARAEAADAGDGSGGDASEAVGAGDGSGDEAVEDAATDDDALQFSAAELDRALRLQADAMIQRLTDGMAELGYPPEGGPEDADPIDKVLMALRGVQADRDELAKRAEQKGEPMSKSDVTQEVTPMALAEKHENAALVAATGGSQVLFVDEDNLPVLPGMAFNAGDYRLAGERAVLNKDIEFPVATPRVQIKGAFLIAGDDTPSGFAQLVAPFEVGGGKKAKLPAGTLSFA